MNTIHTNRQKGIGIIEVMVAAVIFALGIIAIIQLQGSFFTSSSAAQAHSIAMNLAEEKVEDLRGFEAFDDADADIFDFIAIANNLGGQCDTLDDASCLLTIPSGPVTVGNTTFTRTWVVTNYYYNNGVLTTTPNGNIAQKDITVTIAWTDADGSAQTATANAVINSSLVGSGGVLVSNAGGSGESPQVPYAPSNDPRVTPISVGTDSKRETLVPTTETVDGYARSQFTAYTYNSSNILLRQEEFKNVACECRFNGTSTAGNETYAASYPAWDAIEDSYVDVTGELVVAKPKGCVQGGGSNCDANPEPFCEICCRDHHDVAGVAREYDPYRSSDDFEVNGNHKHYNGTTAVTSGAYQESCRLKRVDGYWRVFQDWHMVNFDAVTLADLNDSTIKASYATYAKSIIDQYIDEDKVSGQTLASPPSEPAATNHNVAGNYVNMTVGTPAGISGRALFLDYMDATHFANVKAKKTASEDYLLHIPFYEIELAELVDWTSGNTSVVTVNVADRELHASTTDTNAVLVNAEVRQSNSALTDLSYSVDYNAATHPDTETKNDSLTVCVGCSSGPASSCALPWGGTLPDGGSIYGYSATSVTYPTACSTVRDTLTCSAGALSANSATYTNQSCTQVAGADDCTTSGGWIIGAGVANVEAYSAETASDCSTVDTTLSCSAAGVLTDDNGGTPSDYPYQSCNNVVVTCGTTVAGKKDASAHTISISSDQGDTGVCNSSGKPYSCSITSATNAVITVTSNGLSIIATTCGSQSNVDFPP